MASQDPLTEHKTDGARPCASPSAHTYTSQVVRIYIYRYNKPLPPRRRLGQRSRRTLPTPPTSLPSYHRRSTPPKVQAAARTKVAGHSSPRPSSPRLLPPSPLPGRFLPPPVEVAAGAVDQIHPPATGSAMSLIGSSLCRWDWPTSSEPPWSAKP